MFSGRGMGRGSGAGGGTLRTVSRAVTRIGVSSSDVSSSASSSSSCGSTSSASRLSRKPISSTQPSLSSSVPSVSSCNKNSIFAGLSIRHSLPECDDCDWVSVDEVIEDGSAHGLFGLGLVPSEDEVEDAVYALKEVFGPASHVQLHRDKYYYKLDNHEADQVTIPALVSQASSDGSEIDWEEPTLSPYRSRMLQTNGSDAVYYAFHLLQTESSIQRMVKSLSSDKTVWDAVMNNEVVRELRKSFSADDEHISQATDKPPSSDSHTTANIVIWMFDTAKEKFMEAIQKITKIMNELFQPPNHKTAANAEGVDSFNEKLKTSFMLSIMVLLVVVVSRAHRA